MLKRHYLCLAICVVLAACSGGDSETDPNSSSLLPTASIKSAQQVAIKTLEQLPNLANSEIKQFQQQIEQATTNAAIKQITQTAQAKNQADSFVYKKGVFQNAADLKNYCAAPRPSSADKLGSVQHENLWLRAWNHTTYLWYQEVPDISPENHSTAEYFAKLKTPAAKDRFHYAVNTAEYEGMTGADNTAPVNPVPDTDLIATATEYGYGMLLQGPVVAKVEPYSPADSQGIKRGDLLVKVNDFDLRTEYTADEFNAKLTAVLLPALFPQNDGTEHSNTFVFLRANQEIRRELTAKTIDTYAVPEVKVINHNNQNYGYILFNSHVARAQEPLIAAITAFKQQNVDHLIIDLRYNGGGLIALAAQLGYMSGGSLTANQVFAQNLYNTNPKNPLPATIASTPFLSKKINYRSQLITDDSLPQLDLARVFVLTSEKTCSASEAFINGLRGVGIEVIQIGAATCGKPYGFIPAENCGTTYFTIQFKTANAKGDNDYDNGFSPTVASGCNLREDFKHQLGDNNELLLRNALNYATTGQCQPKATAAAMPLRRLAVPTTPTEAAIKAIKLPPPDSWQNNAFIVPLTNLPQ